MNSIHRLYARMTTMAIRLEEARDRAAESRDPFGLRRGGRTADRRAAVRLAAIDRHRQRLYRMYGV